MTEVVAEADGETGRLMVRTGEGATAAMVLTVLDPPPPKEDTWEFGEVEGNMKGLDGDRPITLASDDAELPPAGRDIRGCVGTSIPAIMLCLSLSLALVTYDLSLAHTS